MFDITRYRLRTTMVALILVSFAAVEAFAQRQTRFRNVLIDARTSIFMPCGDTQGLFWLPRASLGEHRILSFDSPVVGQVSCCGPLHFGGPDGSRMFEGAEVGTDISGAFGISGIQHDDRKMFLAGVFVSNDPCGQPAPPDLRFSWSISEATISGEAILDYYFGGPSPSRLQPRVNQSFFVGDGYGLLGKQEFVIPLEATALRLGFVDGCNLGSGVDPDNCPRPSPPGMYGDNTGFLTATFTIESLKLECNPAGRYGEQNCGPDGRCEEGVCVGCQSASECGTGQVCVAGTCVSSENGFCDPAEASRLRERVEAECRSQRSMRCREDDSCADYVAKRDYNEACARALDEFMHTCFRNHLASQLGPGYSELLQTRRRLVKRFTECNSFIFENCEVRGEASPAVHMTLLCGDKTIRSFAKPCTTSYAATCEEVKEEAAFQYILFHRQFNPDLPCDLRENFTLRCTGGRKCPP